ncbi:hypothetical protein [Chryseobacterium sp.]|uniref:hypothetical protein n=1 Tax=Chryseobacterium sp. TaxID=1871047 RepID=UPI002FCB41A7
MKKLFLVAALGFAGLMSANSTQVVKPNNATKYWIANIKVMTSCGLPAYISWDTDWGLECLMSDAAAADYLTCAP